MKITTKAEQSIFSREQKMTNEQKMRKSTSAPTDAKPHVEPTPTVKATNFELKIRTSSFI